MIAVATLLCDRKASSQMVAIPATARLQGDLQLYINIETTTRPTELIDDAGFYAAVDDPTDFNTWYGDLLWYLKTECPVKWDLDVWSWTYSSWKKRPSYDQDQGRLDYIVTARNMARAYALRQGATHLLLVDSDVIPEPDGLQKLLELDVPLCGGLVPGRGAHKHVHYAFGVIEHDKANNLLRCAHGTCGYMLIRREVLQLIGFQYGRSWGNPEVRLSEDPAFCAAAKRAGFGDFLIRTDAQAEHWDDPNAPLTHAGASRDEEIP